MSSQYPRDEFDVAGEDMPVGMHRPQPSRWKAVWPFLAILVIVPLIAWGASVFLTNRHDSGTASQPSSNTVVGSESGDSSAERQSGREDRDSSDGSASGAAAPQAPQSAESATPAAPEPIIDHNVKISVLNGTGTQGLAARKVSELAEGGFGGASAGNADGWVTQVSTVYYEDPTLEPSARAVGEALGISNVEPTTGLGDPDVVVILR